MQRVTNEITIVIRCNQEQVPGFGYDPQDMADYAAKAACRALMSYEAVTIKSEVTQNQSQPKFTHDCDACEFLAHEDGHDLYVCRSRFEESINVVARYGNDGPKYKSGLNFANGIDEHLTRALELTKE